MVSGVGRSGHDLGAGKRVVVHALPRAPVEVSSPRTMLREKKTWSRMRKAARSARHQCAARSPRARSVRPLRAAGRQTWGTAPGACARRALGARRASCARTSYACTAGNSSATANFFFETGGKRKIFKIILIRKKYIFYPNKPLKVYKKR